MFGQFIDCVMNKSMHVSEQPNETISHHQYRTVVKAGLARES